MKPTQWTHAALTAVTLAAAACGLEPAQQATPPQLVSDLAAQPMALETDTGSPNASACEAIDARLTEHREALAATAEWKALTDTPQWAQLKGAVQRAEDANCELLSAAADCGVLLQRVRQTFNELRATSAYVTAEATDAWQTLKDDYAAAKKNDCWKEWRSLLEPDGPINPSPNPAPNPTPVPPTNPTTGNTEPNGGEPNTSPEPGEGPINPSPNPAPNPTPVPPTNPTTGNTEGGGFW